MITAQETARQDGLEGNASEGARHLCGLGCPVTHVMATPPVFGDPEMSLRAVAETMSADEVGALVLLSPEGPSSIVTEHDIVNALALDANADSVWAADVSSGDLLSLEASATVADAIRLMASEGVRHLPVRREGDVIGMVSSRDVIVAVAHLLPDGT
ncbi:MAG TPA: CBS domain-containing protein [Acidimicrobiales bacterium]|nr:CBS domain-containing protein [Acidimicrobiales bacterium]